MSAKRQVGFVVAVFLSLWIVIPMLYGVVRIVLLGHDVSPTEDTFVMTSIVLSLVWLLLGVLYLTIGAAIRHNTRRD